MLTERIRQFTYTNEQGKVSYWRIKEICGEYYVARKYSSFWQPLDYYRDRIQVRQSFLDRLLDECQTMHEEKLLEKS